LLEKSEWNLNVNRERSKRFTMRWEVAKTKDKLIAYLEENSGVWLSGEELGKLLGISRAAVSKHVKSLREAGLEIESVSRKGHRFVEKNRLKKAELKLLEDIDFITQLIYEDLTGSTNSDAKKLADNGAAEGTIIIAEDQLKGKGSNGRSWFSHPGTGLYSSLILRPEISLRSSQCITILTSVAAAEAIVQSTGIEPTISWHNDLYLKGKKVAGVLTELSANMDRIDYVIVGLGINVNTPKGVFSADLKNVATSLSEFARKEFSRIDILRCYLKYLEKYYKLLLEDRFDLIIQRWKKMADIMGKEVTICMATRTITGRVVDVDGEGVLIIRNERGKLQKVISGEIRLVK